MKRSLKLIIALVLAVSSAWISIHNLTREELTITYVDVGQGDCQIAMSKGHTMVIDGGTAENSRKIVAALNRLGVQYVDYVVCTHAHADHCGGLAGVLSVYDAGCVYAPKTQEDTDSYLNFVKAAKSQGIDIQNPKLGERFELGDSMVEILGPVTEEGMVLNNTSIVLKITYKDTSFLFTGDAEYEEEKSIMESGANLRADVLKIGHHGSSGSSSYSFLREVMPEYAIIGVGKDNTYGHPHKETISRLEDLGAHIYTTEKSGDITVVSDGRNITVSVAKNQKNNKKTAKEQEYMYIGNKKSKKLHASDCKGLPDAKNREYFDNKQEAVADGYTFCRSCSP